MIGKKLADIARQQIRLAAAKAQWARGAPTVPCRRLDFSVT
jgi:hypothetical protein